MRALRGRVNTARNGESERDGKGRPQEGSWPRCTGCPATPTVIEKKKKKKNKQGQEGEEVEEERSNRTKRKKTPVPRERMQE